MHNPNPQKSISNMAAALVLLSGTAHGLSLPAFNSTQGYVGYNDTGPTGFPPCDALISANLSHALHLPASSLYSSLLDDYWSLNTRKAPYCFITPSTVSEVSQVVTALRSAGGGAGDWHIAIRSGGHGGDDSNNIIDGVTIDMSQLNATIYDPVTKVASVGTGARWQMVYDTLDPLGVSVTGGRQGIPGVGGFVLGGGNSWYTARKGFACDGVVNFEVVLASGEVVNANASANSDLWRALKGGSGNFGLVTRFDLETFPAKNLTMETRIISEEHVDDIVDAIVGFSDLDRSFQDNAMLASAAYTAKAGGIVFSIIEVNTNNEANTTAFDAFNHIPVLTPSTEVSATLAVTANQTAVSPGTLNAGFTLTFANDPRVLRYSLDQHASIVADLNATFGSDDFGTVLDIQPLPAYFADIGEEKGGNVLGLEQDPRNKIIFVAGVQLVNPAKMEAQYPLAQQKLVAMQQRIVAYAESIGSGADFVYLNYAHAHQNPLGSYGASNVGHIKEVAGKYDPEAFFQLRVLGGFKIDRVG